MQIIVLFAVKSSSSSSAKNFAVSRNRLSTRINKVVYEGGGEGIYTLLIDENVRF